MSFKVGDAAFTREGLPTVITARDGKTAQLTVNDEPKAVSQAMRHGYINGLSPEMRDQLYEILDDTKDTEDMRERATKMQEKLRELEQDPRNHTLARYLRAEMMHLMNTHGVKPREFTVDESKIR